MASTKYMLYSKIDGEFLKKFTSKDEVIEYLSMYADIRVFKREPTTSLRKCACGELAVPGGTFKCQTCIDMTEVYAYPEEGDEGGEE